MATRFHKLDHTSHRMTSEEQKMKGLKHPKLDRASTRQRFRWSLVGKNILITEPCSHSYHACTKPLSSLKRTFISELKVNIPSKGKYLLVRTLEKPLKGAHIPMFGTTAVLLVEDQNKDVTFCCLCGYVISHFRKAIEELLPVNTVFALKEPQLKPCMDDSLAVVVGSPSDFLIVDRSHALSEDLEYLGWRRKLCDVDESIEISDLLLIWKDMGYDYYKQGKYDKAIESYRVALDRSEDFEMKLVFNLNLAACYLSTGYFESALKHSSKALELQPKNEKALYRAGRAQYELRQYRNAREFFEVVLSVNPSNTDARSEKLRCEIRLEEEGGKVDVFRLHNESIESPYTPLDCGTYTGPVKVRSIFGRNRSAIATSDIKAGTLILVDRSLAYTPTCNIDAEHTMEEFIANAVSDVLKNPETFGRQIYGMHAPKPKTKHEKIFRDEKNRSEPIVYVYCLNNILFTNNITSDHQKFEPTVWQIFVLASGFNHSCIPNCTFTIYNNIICIRTCKLVKKGEELTISYLSCFVGHGSRQEFFKIANLTCSCTFCNLQDRELVNLHDRRDELHDIAGPIQDKHFAANILVKSYSDIVNEVKKTYRGRSLLCVSLYAPCFYLAAAIMMESGKDWESRFNRCVEEGLNCIGLSEDLLLKAAEEEHFSFPQNTILTQEVFDYVVLIAEKELLCNRIRQVSRWKKVLMYLENLFTGGNIKMLQHTLKKKSYILGVDVVTF